MNRQFVIRMLAALGLLRLMRWLRRNDLIILYLHGVADPEDDETWRPLRLPHSTGVLERQLDIISRHYHWVTMDEAVAMLAGKKKMRPYSVVLTFDDGYRNNMTHALPIARAKRIKPVFYIATGFVNDRKPFWFDRFDYMIQRIQEPVALLIGDTEYRFLPRDRENSTRVYAKLRNHAKAFFDTDEEFGRFFETTCERIERHCGSSIHEIQAGDKWSGTLADADLAQLATSGRVTIGSHTVDHNRLDKMPAEDCSRQLADSARYLDAVTGENCRHFCYPNGSFNDAAVRLVAAAGYESAVTTTAGFNSPGADLHKLHRFHLPDHADESRILAMLSGLFLLRDRIRRRLGRRHGDATT